MKQRRILSACLALVMVLSMAGCASVTRSSGNVEFTYLANGFIDDVDADLSGAYTNSEDEAVLANMVALTENNYATLYMGADYDIAVRDKKTGAVFFSNPGIYGDFAQGDEDRSQVTIEFYDGSGTKTVMSSYTESVSKNQVSQEVNDGVVSVTYEFGTRSDDMTMCPVFTSETYAKVLEQIQALVDAEEISLSFSGRFKTSYVQVAWDLLSETEQAQYLKQFPNLKELKEVYVLRSDLSDLQKRGTGQISAMLGIDKAFIEEELERIGEHSLIEQKALPYFSITVDYRLDGRDLIVTIDPAKVYEQEGYALVMIRLAGGLGTMQPSENREMLVVDGSGSIIKSKPERSYITELSIPFYGVDEGVNILTADEIPADSSFPVFGSYDEGKRAVFAIAESGDALGGVTVYPATDVRSSCRVEPYLYYRVMDYLDLKGMNKYSSQKVYSDPCTDAPYVLRYHFLYDENADYSGMARYYRAYLIQTGALKADADVSYKTDIGFVGAFTKDKLSWGVQVKEATAATTFEQAQTILKQLEEAGLTDIRTRFLGALDGGLDNTAPVEPTVEECLGGLEGLRELAKQQSLFTAVDFTAVYRKGDGLDEEKHLSRYLSKNYATTMSYLPADGKLDNSRTGFLISPAVYPQYAAEFLATWQGDGGLFLPSVGSKLSSDFYSKDPVSREESKYLAVDMLAKLKSADQQLLLDGANTYALAYADGIVGLPVENEGYKIADRSVPFVAMVLHSSISYSGALINQQADSRYAVLKSVENGAGLNYLLMQEDPVILAGTNYTNMYSMFADHWLEPIADEAKKVEAALAPLANQAIVQHKWLTDEVAQTVYEDGTMILVNYGETSYTVDGVKVGAMDYLVRKGAQ